MTGTTRTAVRLAAAGTALAALFTGGTALAGTGTSAGTTGTVRALGPAGPAGPAGPTATATATATASLPGGTAAAVRIPRNFLLHEAKARGPVRYPEEERWTIRDGLRGALEIELCGPRRPSDTGRTAMRTVVHEAPEHRSGEQLVIYRSAGAARRAMAGILAHVGRCARVPSEGVVVKSRADRVRAGDRAVRISVQSYDAKGVRPAIGGQRAVVVRRDRALVIYVLAGEYGRVRDSDFTRQLKDAGRMAAKVCSLRGLC
ncbi:hypothetical protein [Streptosporangium sp. NPDC023615]|uniref:hypothetical protein n=1 Tax=Streptosporangium sp. NPDC023615 TaxID=3154794 RepID=UPI00343FFE13